MKISVEHIEDIEEIGEKVRAYKERIYHRYNPTYYKNRALMFHRWKVPQWLFDDIIVKGIENVKKVEDKQLVYVSNHVSMADFLVQGYILWRENLPIPRFLAGENLNRIGVGKFFRKCGAIFIDRNEKDRLYWVVENEYIKKILFNNEDLLVYPEGTRTDGAPVRLKTGTLSQLIQVAEKEQDIWIAPIYIDYNKRIEEWVIKKVRENKNRRDGLLERARELKKERKNLRAKIINIEAKIRDWIYFDLDLLAYFARLFVKEKGNAYLTFGEAFPLKEFRKKFDLAEKVRRELGELKEHYGKL